MNFTWLLVCRDVYGTLK